MTAFRSPTRTFDLASQRAFADLSGDHNPLHVDPVAARRTQFGFPLVHGVHAALWALEVALEQVGRRLALTSLRVELRAPMRVSDALRCAATWRDDNTLDATIENKDRSALRLSATFSIGTDDACDPLARPDRLECADLSFEDATRVSGALRLAVDSEALGAMLPHVARVLGRLQVAELLATTRLVGMACPGLHSILAKIDLAPGSTARGSAQLSYRVARHSVRYFALWLAVEGPTLSGTLETFYRSPPTAQASMSSIAALVTVGEFTGDRVLVVGGSRGLGEVAAKLAAAGGAELAITYQRGEGDARRVASEIEAAGGRCRVFAFDAREPMSDLGVALGPGWVPTKVFYFATPFIGSADSSEISLEKLHAMFRVYVDGLYETVRVVRTLGGGRLAVLYPSTVFLDSSPPGFAEYCVAKAAGEALCALLPRTMAGISVHCPRLPRMRTDQTQGILSTGTPEPAPILLREIRRLGYSP
jgi:acyl dehydratase/NAD(P)-dependent dehydrogenase (short-subunit alcohol dehydrogenase family)